MKKILLALALLIAAAVATSLLLRPVAKVAAAAPGLAVKAVPGSVTVRAEFEQEIKSEQSGRVVESTLDQGGHVKKGDMLIQIDPGDLKLDIEHTESEYEAAKARIAVGSPIKLELLTAQDNFKNYERLAKAGSYPMGDLEKQRRIVESVQQRLALEEVNNKALIEGYENTLKVRRRALDKMTIRAQFDGIVSMVYARPGALISSGAPIALLISTSRTVEVRISEEYFSSVKLGQKADVRFLGYGDQLYPATVDKLLPTADPDTQRYIAHLKVNIPIEKLTPGLTGEATIVVDERQAQTIIPRRALQGRTVLLVEDGRVRQREVEVGFVSLTAVEVLKGLKPGDLVIVEDLDLYRDGQRVKPVTVSAE